VHYAATEVEARFCMGDVLAVVGGGNSAGQATLYLARHASVVHLLVRDSDLTASMSRYLVDRIEQCPNVQLHLGVEARALIGEAQLEGVVVQHTSTSVTETVPARYLFVFIGAEPNAGWLGDEVQLDSHGFIRTGTALVATHERSGPSVGQEPSFLETSRPGVFAAGDIRSGSIKRVASAVGEGAMAVRLVYEYLSVGARSA
jgi:thioredoxin reductase (NADPH)